MGGHHGGGSPRIAVETPTVNSVWLDTEASLQQTGYVWL